MVRGSTIKQDNTRRIFYAHMFPYTSFHVLCHRIYVILLYTVYNIIFLDLTFRYSIYILPYIFAI